MCILDFQKWHETLSV